jgi:hypothetical protein
LRALTLFILRHQKFVVLKLRSVSGVPRLSVRHPDLGSFASPGRALVPWGAARRPLVPQHRKQSAKNADIDHDRVFRQRMIMVDPSNIRALFLQNPYFTFRTL